MIRSNGSDGIDMFPSAPIYIGAHGSPQISGDGSRVELVYSTEYLYTGKLWPDSALYPGPRVQSITFDPAEIPDDEPGATVVLTAAISDPNGLADVARTSLDHLIDGAREEHQSDLPVYFAWDPHDDGSTPDANPGDGIYSTSGETGGAYPGTTEVTIRVSVQDDDVHVGVRDVDLFVCPPEGLVSFVDDFDPAIPPPGTVRLGRAPGGTTSDRKGPFSPAGPPIRKHTTLPCTGSGPSDRFGPKSAQSKPDCAAGRTPLSTPFCARLENLAARWHSGQESPRRCKP